MNSDFLHRLPVRGKGDIRRLQREMGYALKDLLAMSAGSDPFNAGTPANRRQSEWFKDQWVWACSSARPRLPETGLVALG